MFYRLLPISDPLDSEIIDLFTLHEFHNGRFVMSQIARHNLVREHEYLITVHFQGTTIFRQLTIIRIPLLTSVLIFSSLSYAITWSSTGPILTSQVLPLPIFSLNDPSNRRMCLFRIW